MSLFSALKNLNNILVTFSLQEEVSLAPTYHVSSQAMKIFIPGIQNAIWVFSCSFSSWEHYYLHAVKRGRQLEKLQHRNNIGKPGKLYVKHFFQCYGSKKWKLLQRKFFFFFFFFFCFTFFFTPRQIFSSKSAWFTYWWTNVSKLLEASAVGHVF